MHLVFALKSLERVIKNVSITLTRIGDSYEAQGELNSRRILEGI